MNELEALETWLGKLDAWVLIFGIIVAVGVTGEATVGLIHWWHGGTLTELRRRESRKHDETIERLKNETADAQRETAKLKAELAWRELDAKAKDELIAALHPFKGQRIDVFSYPSDPEGEAFGKQIIDNLKLAGVEPSTGKVSELSKLLYGARVEIGDTTQTLSGFTVSRIALTPSGKKAAEELDKVLRKHGIVTEPMASMMPRSLDFGMVPMSEAPVRLMVGIKPR